MRKKHRKDKNNGKNGGVSGNPRYRRKPRKAHPKDRSMGSN